MAKITSEILRKIAPGTPTELRDRFIPYLNDILPRYGIVSEFQVAAFLATAAFESMYFKKTKEGKAKPTSTAWIKYQSKYWHTNYMGRGIFQTTSLANYRKFGQKMKAKGLVTDSEIFVKQPELLEQPKWAVESACEFWETNGLDKYARQGLRGFTPLQGVVNRGSASKIALGNTDRLAVYERAMSALPDGFTLNSAAPVTKPASETTRESSQDETVESATPPIQQNADQIINTAPPPAPIEPTTPQDLPAPAPMGSVQTAGTVTFLGFAVPTFIVAAWKAITDLIDKGFIKAEDIGTAVLNLITNNGKYILIGVGLVILVIIVKKVERAVIFIVTIITHAIPSLNSITVVAPEPVAKKPWWRIW